MPATYQGTLLRSGRPVLDLNLPEGMTPSSIERKLLDAMHEVNSDHLALHPDNSNYMSCSDITYCLFAACGLRCRAFLRTWPEV